MHPLHVRNWSTDQAGWKKHFYCQLIFDFVLHSTSGAVARTGAAFGQGSGGVFLDNVVCDGFERRLVDCASHPPASSNCPHTRDAGVVCQPAISREFTGINCFCLWEIIHQNSIGTSEISIWHTLLNYKEYCISLNSSRPWIVPTLVLWL